MKDIPVPTLGLSPTQLMPSQLPRGSLHPVMPAPAAKLDEERSAQNAVLSVTWASHLDEVREAQRLRYAVFAGEMGASLSSELAGHDVDRFDDFCEHLLVRDQNTGHVVGTYRLLTPVQAHRAGGLYTGTEFDIQALDSLKPQMVELGRSCVHADYRHGAVIMALWGALAQFMLRNQLSSMVGCASIPMLHQGRVSGDAAASIWHQVSQTHLADPTWHVHAHTPLPINQFDLSLDVEPPALIKGYLRLGARVLGAPAWDPDFNTADLPMLLRIEDMPTRYRKHFLGA
ncbi:GNAT family N-acyltransferase [Variovorax sp. PCZ-1]|uniref:GNAT family N-acetyltransferase n=1 Tax=Variovorax sp. PCZ-1 TaxID=2835533 RepID=UPI001BCB2A01|nr:GNAT family N-acyltransferase [Variovorax sp. PCZ-1]MBS7806691.1 GNAT family N-acetyltransferase [Variovorax sp. PCZ-1]